MVNSTLRVDLEAVDVAHLLVTLGEPPHRMVNDSAAGDAVLTIFGMDQAVADAALSNYTAPTPTGADIWAECRRRKHALLGAPDQITFEEIRVGGVEQAVELLDVKSDRAWTTAEATRAAELRAAQDLLALHDLTAVSLVMSVPLDYKDDKHWP